MNANEVITYLPPHTVKDVDLVAMRAMESPYWDIENMFVQWLWEQLYVRGINGGENCVIAVFDTGVDPNHPDLKHIVEHRNFTNLPDPFDENSHGTWVASKIRSGIGGGAMSRYGLTDAEVANYRVLGQYTGLMSWVNDGLYDFTDNYPTDKQKIVTMSLGSTVLPESTKQAIDYALSKNVWINVAAGNAGEAGLRCPGCYEPVGATGAFDRNFNLAPFSSIDEPGLNRLDWVGPGVDVFGAVLGGGYKFYSGTSMATPWVTSMMAILKSLYPGITTQEEIVRLLRGYCVSILDKMDYLYPTPNQWEGWGKPDLKRFVEEEPVPEPDPEPGESWWKKNGFKLAMGAIALTVTIIFIVMAIKNC